jgi:uncharacterized cupin superfamily protein
MPNVNRPNLDEQGQQPGFGWRGESTGLKAGCERLGASVYVLPPGEATFPYHYHFANEELLIVLSGRPHLRTPDGWRQLEEGEVVAFPVGERGAHQLANRTDETVRLLVVSPSGTPEILVYPDSDKVGVYEPLSRRDDHRGHYRRNDAVDYYEGEEPPLR